MHAMQLVGAVLNVTAQNHCKMHFSHVFCAALICGRCVENNAKAS